MSIYEDITKGLETAISCERKINERGENRNMSTNDLAWLSKQNPCPNCQGEGRVIAEMFEDGDTLYRPECGCCKIALRDNYPTIKEAVEAWNEQGE